MADADPPDAAAAPRPAIRRQVVVRREPGIRRQLVVRRILQFTVDLSLMTLVCLIPLAASALLVPQAPDGTVRLFAGLLAFFVVTLMTLLIAVGYWVWLPGRSRVDRLGGGGQTVGMRWFRLRVIDEGGGDPTHGQLAVRWLMLLVDGIGFGLVAVVAMFMSPRGQRVGDLMAGTVVVGERHHRPSTTGAHSRVTARPRTARRHD